ncbi:MAG: hypothetical protein M1834_004479 [Cirrosporium novae-zelandiae]|nr:MAG: hypothetical protein M1834_004479 [Cirrosporium novae-zelandiae]
MSSTKPPNFLIIVADDLGFSDTGPYGSEIHTPTLDRLAKGGVTMTGFHTAAACSPTRSMLFSGTDNHIAGLGQMAEHMSRSFKPGTFDGKPGYEGYLNFRVAALPEILQDNGYLTLMSGKWHLGLKKEFSPHARGFSKAFTYLAGSGNHFNHEPQLEDLDPHFPCLCGDGLWMEDGRFLNRKTEIPEDFYSTTSFTDRLLHYFKGRTESEKEMPFFSYLAFTAPHWPLQAPSKTIKKYAGKYDDGPNALRSRRLEALIQRGLVPANATQAPLMGEMAKEWNEMNSHERAVSARRMETYAAMVDLIDQNIERVISYLESTSELDNTFILFMSDNGAEGKLLEALPVMADTPIVKVISKFYDNSLQNIGNYNSFVWYGPRWAGAATAPSRGFKTWSTEGGIRCPCIIHYPPLALSRGSASHIFTTVMDILPTILDLAGITHPGTRFRNRNVVTPRGRSWTHYLNGKEEIVHESGQNIMGWELFGRRAIRRGDWKAVYIPGPDGPNEWELYDLSKDQGEIHNLANKQPQIMEELLREWSRYTTESGVYLPEDGF